MAVLIKYDTDVPSGACDFCGDHEAVLPYRYYSADELVAYELCRWECMEDWKHG